MDPTLAGFVAFVQGVMGISVENLPADSPALAAAYSMAVNVAYPGMKSVPCADPMQPSIYALAVYNLAGDFLINFASDQPGKQFFSGLRESFQINAPISGAISSVSDASTSTSFVVPEAFSNLTIGQLQSLKTPYGRMYLSLAQSAGSLWGIS